MKRFLLFFLILNMLISHSKVYALETDTIRKEIDIPLVEYRASVKDFILPVSLLTVGVVASVTDHKDIFSISRSDRKTGESNWEYLLFGGVAGSMYIFDRYIESEHNAFDQSMLLLFSAGLSLVPAYIVKESYDSYRPDGGPHSFPSGHTTAGFMIAHVLNKEFRNSNLWVAYGGYVIASAVGISRLTTNKHWLSDILGGAGVGILGTELAYLIYFPVRNKIAQSLNKKYNKEISFSPMLSVENLGLSVCVKF